MSGTEPAKTPGGARHIDPFAPATMDLLLGLGHVYVRNLVAVNARQPNSPGEVVVTHFAGFVETTVYTQPDTHVILQGAKEGEEYAVPLARFNAQYHPIRDGQAMPYSRRIYVMQNLFGCPIVIDTQWGVDGTATQECGGPGCYVAYDLDEDGTFLGSAYLIHDAVTLEDHWHLADPAKD